MNFLREAWTSQRRRVSRLNQFVEYKREEEQQLRLAMKNRATELATRFETMFLVGATGAVWASRIRDRADEEPMRPVAELAAAALIVARWRHLVGRVRSRWLAR